MALQVAAEIRLRPGTRLVRGWNGTSYSVLVTDGGFLFEDRTYRSLSHIAREITGVLVGSALLRAGWAARCRSATMPSPGSS